MSEPHYRVVRLTPDYDLSGFDCGEPTYNDWLARHASASVQAGVCAVYLLVEAPGAGGDGPARVVGYYAINPTQVVRADAPKSLARGWPRTVPTWKLGKLAVHVDLRDHKDARWGRQLLRDALETIVRIAEAGGGKVIVVDADNAGLLRFYTRNGFKTAGIEGDLALYLKVSTARAVLDPRATARGADNGADWSSEEEHRATPRHRVDPGSGSTDPPAR